MSLLWLWGNVVLVQGVGHKEGHTSVETGENTSESLGLGEDALRAPRVTCGPGGVEGGHAVEEEEGRDITKFCYWCKEEMSSNSGGSASGGPEGLREEITRELVAGTYVCLVCTDNVASGGEIWSCNHCHRVFDLSCAREWAQADAKATGTWRCPSCNHTHTKIPKKYTCWCGRITNPPSSGLDPHSCGLTCGARLRNRGCPHGCSLTCHPGPHLEKCHHQGPQVTCNCGKNTKQTLCGNTPKRGWMCGELCGDKLGCLEHSCKRRCHKGLCGECRERVLADCYCGKEHDVSIRCADRIPHSSSKDAKSWLGMFQCEAMCQEPLDCGNHTCNGPCHPQGKNAHECPLAVEKVSTCVCGKTSLEKLGVERKSCLDPVPTCEEVCGKLLACGHRCYWTCHEGDCAPCYQAVELTCACGSHTTSVACRLAQDGYAPRCDVKCNVLKSCRRHHCTTRCCASRNEGIAREMDIKKKIRHGQLTHDQAAQVPVEAQHFCVETCGKTLACGRHKCEAVCHAGACAPCIQSQFEDLTCNCGKTVLHAPYRCGTKLPPCEYECVRTLECGHPNDPHHCHPDNVSCPPCRHLTVKRCRCDKHNLIANIICSQDSSLVSCMSTCGKQLVCGIEGHTCMRECHEGPCGKACLRKCGQTRSCGHQCTQPCHAKDGKQTDCPDVKCTEAVDVACKCGERSVTVQCWVVQKLAAAEAEAEAKAKAGAEAEAALAATALEANSTNDLTNEIIAANEAEISDTKDSIQVNLQLKPDSEHAETTEAVETNPSAKSELDVETAHSPSSKLSLEGESHASSESAVTPDLTEDVSPSPTPEATPAPPIPNSHLPCTDDCRKLHRSRLMFNALQLSQRQNSALTFDYKLVEEIYSPFVLDIMDKQPKWCLGIESVFRSITIGKVIRGWGVDYEEDCAAPKKTIDPKLSAGAKLLFNKQNNRSALDSYNALLPSHHFKPMKTIQRKFIHELAQAWNLKSVAQDPEPRRSVLVKVTSESTIPNVGLSRAVNVYREYLTLKKAQDAEAAAQAEIKRLEQEAKEKEMKLLEEQRMLEKSQEPEAPVPVNKLWNAVMIRGIQSGVLLEDCENEIKNVYSSSDLASIESVLASVSDEIWVLMFELGPQHNYNEAKVLLSSKIVKLCSHIELKVVEHGWATECFPCLVEDGIVLEIGEWTNEETQEETIDIEVESSNSDEDPPTTKWWS